MQSLNRVQWIKGGIVLFLSISIGFLWYFFSSSRTSSDQAIPGLFGFLLQQKFSPLDEFQGWQDRNKTISITLSGTMHTKITTGIFEHTKFPIFSSIDTAFSGTVSSNIFQWESNLSFLHHIDTQTGILIVHNLSDIQTNSGNFIQLGNYSSNNTLLIYPDLSLREQFLKNYQKKRIEISSPIQLKPCQQRSIISSSGNSYSKFPRNLLSSKLQSNLLYECTRENEISTATLSNNTLHYSFSGQEYISSLSQKSGESGVLSVSGFLSFIPREITIYITTVSDEKRQKSYSLKTRYSYGSSVSGSGVIEMLVTPTEKQDIKAPEQSLEWGKIMKVLEGN